MSNNRNFEACVCPSGKGVVEYACNCGATPVFLCRNCIATHFAEPRSHTLISLEQAKALNRQGIVRNSEHIDKLNNLKSKLEGYNSKLADFTSRIRAAKSDIKSRIDRVFDSRISQLEDISAEIRNKIEQISRQASSFDQVGSLTLEKFEAKGIEGVITRYYDSLNFYQEDIEFAIDNSLFIGRSSDMIIRFPYRDLAKYNEVYQENVKLRRSLKTYREHYEKWRNNYDESTLGTQYFSKLNYEECVERYNIYIKNYGLYCLDKIKNQISQYNIKLSEDMKDSIKCCLSPDGYLFLVGSSEKAIKDNSWQGSRLRDPYSNTDRHFNILSARNYNDTFKIDLDQMKIFNLSNMNVRRDCVALICKGDYLYAFGGYDFNGESLKAVERLNLRSQRWDKLSDMVLPVSNGTCYSYKHFIIIRNTSMQYQYFDENTLQIYEIKDLNLQGYYGPEIIKGIDNRIFIIRSIIKSSQFYIRISISEEEEKEKKQQYILAALSDDMNVIYVNKSLEQNTYCIFPHTKEGGIETVCIKVNDTSISFHDVFKPNYDITKEVQLIMPTLENP